jgi:filamentous hemagglutinin family protein
MIKHLLSFLTTTALFLLPNIVQAQTYQPSNRTPVADSTLSTQVSGSGNFNITGGLSKGQTLFHSFTDFSVPTNGAANFLNSVGNRDIITRVTGGLFSDINGLVNSNGANFFLINPNGIVFGPNAQLNVGRAFMASTANGIDLVDGGGRAMTFGTNPNGDAPLLNVALNVLFDVSRLNLGGGNGAISNFGTLQTNNQSQYIGLIGGNVTLNGGQINAPGGKVDLGGLAAPGSITWSENKLIYPTGLTRSNVTLTDGASVSVAGSGGGSVAVNAQNLNVLDGSEIAAGISQNAPNSQAGDIDINVERNIEVGGNILSAIRNEVSRDFAGNAGNISIKTDHLRVVDGSSVTSSTFGIGNAGNITINANSIEIDRESTRTSNSAPFPTGLFAQVEPTGNGNAGNITLATKTLSVSNGGKIQAATFGKGNGGGNVVIKAEEINVFNTPGVNPEQLTNINAGVGFDSDRNQDSAGNPVFAESQGGNLTIGTRRLSVRNGAAVTSDTIGIGNGGKVSITATDLLEVTGNNSRLSVGVRSGATGNGGEMALKTKRLIIKDKGYISTASIGTGIAGKLKIDAKIIELQNQAEIIARTLSGQGGNIDLNVSDYLLMRQNSQISATAGTANSGGDGGNITINSPLVVALPGNSDITANAYTGKGGTLTIKSDGLFGIQYRIKGKESNFTNDITASSEFNQQGTVNINTPGTDPGKDSTELPKVTTDASKQISQVCSGTTRQNKLTVTGRGGVPPTANDPLTSDVIWQDARAASSQPAVSSATTNPAKLAPPAVGWVFDGKGKVTLVAAGTEAQPTRMRVVCPNIK